MIMLLVCGHLHCIVTERIVQRWANMLEEDTLLSPLGDQAIIVS